LEVAFREDQSRARARHTIANLGLRRRLDPGIHHKQIHVGF
jgi:hypothetical protein